MESPALAPAHPIWHLLGWSLVTCPSGQWNPATILSRKKNPVCQPNMRTNSTSYCGKTKTFTAGGGEDLRQVPGPQPEPGIGSAWPCLGIHLGPSRPECQEQ